MPHEYPSCTIRYLPPHMQAAAVRNALALNPVNRPLLAGVLDLLHRHVLGLIGDAEAPVIPQPDLLAVMTSKYWGSGGVKLSVGFLDNPPADLRARILLHMNSWSEYANVRFMETSGGDGQVRIARVPGEGYYSYLGTDILSIPHGQPTMNLDSFTMNTPESEYHRVVRHETGHTLGCPHEHLRRELVARLDRNKTIVYFQRQYGWSPQTTTQQVLTPIDEASLMGTPHADAQSIMCYQISGSCTLDGQPIVGGTDIDPTDQAFIARVYPPVVQPPPPPPPPPPPTGGLATVQGLDATGGVLWKAKVG